ncbi:MULTISPECIES: transposase [unclassified Frankia]|uniref:transposase n=1 Tax=unclassified Frankia TaxID=2632575 RepID=UPI002AD383CA|nr:MULTISPECIES: transposase [unclassified Frankia]
MENINDSTAAWASIEDVADRGGRVDAQVRAVLGRVMAQRRSTGVAFDEVAALAPGTRANCWPLAEAAGHEGPHRMQALLRSYRWDWKTLRTELAGLVTGWLPDSDGDLTGPGIAIDETAHLKKGRRDRLRRSPARRLHGQGQNCVTTVFCAYVTAHGQAWVDFDVYLPQRWAEDPDRRKAAGVPDDLAFATNPELAIGQVRRGAAGAVGSLRRGVRVLSVSENADGLGSTRRGTCRRVEPVAVRSSVFVGGGTVPMVDVERPSR